jgi:hypothetical protein
MHKYSILNHVSFKGGRALVIPGLPGYGPNDNLNARRRDPSGLIQQSAYNGWKSEHGLKTQCVFLPNGLIGDVSLSESLRHNDLWYLAQSGLDQRLTDCQTDPANPNRRKNQV